MLFQTIPRLLPTLLLITTTLAADKQIKLEDIEKDNLKAAEQSKYEKQFAQFQGQYDGSSYSGAGSQPGPAYQQQAALSYQPQAQAGLSYQPQAQAGLSYQQGDAGLPYQMQSAYQQAGVSPYSQYLLPYSPQQYQQQYIPQALYQGNYPQLSGNAVGGGYQAGPGPVHPFQAYFSQQLQQVPSGPTQASPSQLQPIVMNIPPGTSLAALQQQASAYFQGLSQYTPPQGSPAGSFYYPQQQGQSTSSLSSAAPSSSPLLYSQQSYVPPFQSLSNGKTAYASQYPSNQYTSQYSPSFSGASSPYTSQAFSNQAEPPTFTPSLKSYSQGAASLGQQQQYLQAIGSTVSPYQQKYMNSPQFLSQNYNTIQSSQFSPKGAYSSLAKSTASPPKTQSGFSPSSSPVSYQSSSPQSYQSFRSISG